MTTVRGIAISGRAGVGKTTLAAHLAGLFEVPLIEELMRPLIESGVDLHDLTSDQRKALLLDHYDKAIAAMKVATASHGGFVSDRSPADFAAFWLHYGFGDDDETDGFLSRAAADSALVDLAIMLPWGAIPLVNDGRAFVRPLAAASLPYRCRGYVAAPLRARAIGRDPGRGLRDQGSHRLGARTGQWPRIECTDVGRRERIGVS